MRWMRFVAVLIAMTALTGPAQAQTDYLLGPRGGGLVTYLGNEGLVVDYGTGKVLIDGLYDEDMGRYQLTPPHLRAQLMAGLDPFDRIDAVLVTHLHPDHFSADALAAYMAAQPQMRAFLPADAAAELRRAAAGKKGVAARITAIEATPGSAVVRYSAGPDGEVRIEALKIPHPASTRKCDHLVFRVTLKSVGKGPGPGGEIAFLHGGDMDHEPMDLVPYAADFAAKPVDVAFVPYWRLAVPGLARQLNAGALIGIHVPAGGSEALSRARGEDWFETPGESRVLGPAGLDG